MVKPYICNKKNCWETKNTVLVEADRSEEHHFDEDLLERIIPHTHKKGKVINEDDEIISAIENLKKIKMKSGKDKDSVFKKNDYQKNKTILKGSYDKEKIYPKIYYKEIVVDENVSATDAKTANKILIDYRNFKEKHTENFGEDTVEKHYIYGIKKGKLQKTYIDELKKKGILLNYIDNKFDLYQ